MGQQAYQQSLDYLYHLEKFGMIFGLTQVQRILSAIGNPHKEIQAIHIGGTNGKGSTAAMMNSILQNEGYAVGLYTSPHLIRFTERIKVNGEEIEEEKVAELAGWMRKEIEAAGITPPFTFFDFTTAMALLEGVLFVVLLANLDIGWLQNPIYYSHAQNQIVIRSLPGYWPSQVAMAAAFSDTPRPNCCRRRCRAWRTARRCWRWPSPSTACERVSVEAATGSG